MAPRVKGWNDHKTFRSLVGDLSVRYQMVKALEIVGVSII